MYIYIYIIYIIYIYILLTTILQEWSLEIHSNISKKISEVFFVISYLFRSLFSFLLSLVKLSRARKHQVYNIYRMSYTLSFCFLMYYMLSEIYIDGRFLEDCFYCHSEQVIPAGAREPWFPITLYKEQY